MADPALVDRLAALPPLREIPREELEWLAEHGELMTFQPGSVVSATGEAIDRLWIVLEGNVEIAVDRGTGPKRVMSWRTGDVSGKLPFSRMVGSPGDNVVVEPTEVLGVHVKHAPELVRRCPGFTAHCVHLMLDRARRFNASDLQDEKMVSLGKLAAGLAHELNNPASATIRGAKQLLESLTETDAILRALAAASLTEDLVRTIEEVRIACLARPGSGVMSPIERADREDAIAEWLERHRCDVSHAARLAETAVSLEALDALAKVAEGDTLHAALRWITTACQVHSLAGDIEQAATQIHELVAAVKRFTYMDHLTASELVDVEGGLRDTVRVFASKARSKDITITIDVEPDLPPVRASGPALNQVWSNLLDNALDAVPKDGHIEVRALREVDQVLVTVIDDGPGIPPDVLPWIFDPFYTTKPPGQGTGLGLDIARRLLRQNHGDITVDSRPGRTAFTVRLAVGSPGSA